MLIRRKTMMSTVMHDVNVIQTHTNLVSSRVVRYNSYTASVVCDEGYSVYEITIKMGGVDITSTAYDPTYNMISIPSVTDDVEINVVAIMPVMFYKVDGSGTEEIISEENACAPMLSLRYPDGGVEKDTRFTYRKTANGQRLNVNGNAFIANIKGETVSWNQLIQNGNFENTQNWTALYSTLSASDNELTITKGTSTAYGGFAMQSINGLNTSHKYYISCYAKVGTAELDFGVYFGFFASGGSVSGNTNVFTTNATYTRLQNIVSPKAADNVLGIRCGVNSTTSGHIAKAHSCICIDLTLIYGVGKEPTTAAAFEADYFKWFGKPLTYEAYNTGTLKPVKMLSIKTIGFNLWDEEWELGSLSLTSGDKIWSTRQIRTKNFIPCFPSTSYRTKIINPSNGSVNGYILYYDSDKKYCGWSGYANDYAIRNATKTTPSNAYYFRFYCNAEYGTTYNNDIVVNVPADLRDGTYLPHWSNTSILNVTELKGRVVTNGVPSGESVTIFPDGMKKAGSVYDEIVKEDGALVAYQRVGTRAYESATDDSDTTVTTDFRSYTNYPLDTPIKYVVQTNNN